MNNDMVVKGRLVGSNLRILVNKRNLIVKLAKALHGICIKETD